jgi:putative NADPH-quinone reductase
MPWREALAVLAIARFTELLHPAAPGVVGISKRSIWRRPIPPAASRQALVINGHPDPRPERYCAALSSACAKGFKSGGWDTHELALGALQIPGVDGQSVGEPSIQFTDACRAFRQAARLVIVFPLWLNRPPALLTRFFEEAIQVDQASGAIYPASRRRKAQLIVTMELPAFAHRTVFATGIAGNTLSLPGIAADETIFIGGINSIPAVRRSEWLRTFQDADNSARA